MTPSDTPVVIIVCRANRIRSPIAEHLLRARLGAARINWYVRSCGTHAHGGLPMDTAAQAFLAGHGLDVADTWRTSPLRRDLLERADLILTADPTQRSTVVETYPPALRSTFTLRQFARIADRAGRLPSDIRRGQADELLTAVVRARALQPVSADDDSIPDPADSAVPLLASAELIEQATAAIARAFASSTS